VTITMSTGVPILVYHSVDDSGCLISVSPHFFRRQMYYLHENGYRTVSLPEALKYVKTSERKRLQDEKLIVITFDDGYQTVYTQALPVLEQCSFNATVFLAAGLCGREIRWKYRRDVSPKYRMLTWDEVKLMGNRGIDFGAHTLTHRRLTDLSLDAAREEIWQSKLLIEHMLGRSVDTFAFPFGMTNDSLKSIVRGAFRAACTASPGFLRAESDPYQLPRLSLGGYVVRLVPSHLFLRRFPHLYVGWKRLVAMIKEPKVKYAIED